MHRSWPTFGVVAVLSTIALFIIGPAPPMGPSLRVPIIKAEPPRLDSEVAFTESHPLTPKPITSVNEFRRRVGNDKALAKFYREAGFDISCAWLEELPSSRFAKVTWRRGGKFGWSQHPQLLLEHENVIVDCRGNTLRAKCGNLIAIERQPAAETMEIPPSELSVTREEVAPLVIAAEVPPVLPLSPEAPAPLSAAYPLIPPSGFYGGGGNLKTPATPPETVPEPSSIALVVAGIVGLIVARRRAHGSS